MTSPLPGNTAIPSRPSGRMPVPRLAPYLLAVLAAFAATGLFIGLLGFNVLTAYETILFTSFRTANGFIQTLQKFVPLLLQALAFTLPLAAGKFNIGGEGQMIAGAIGTTAVAILLADLPGPILLPLALLAGVICGALWAAPAAWLLYRFKVNEILTTVLLNFVAFNLIDYVATGIWRDPAAGHPTTIAISAGARLPLLVASPRLHSGLLLSLVIALAAYLYIGRTSAGYELVATGANPRAARVFGIDVRRIFLLSLIVGGAIAGLSGAIEVAGVHYRLIEGLQSNFLLLGIIIGLIARGNHAAVPFVAFFIAVLEVGASALQRTLQIPGGIVTITEALILFFLLLSDWLRRR